MASIKRLWAFRSLPNFSLTVLGISGLGLVCFSVMKQNKFSNPIIAQSIKILGTTQKIRQVLGYPLTYKASFSNSYQMNNDEQYYAFSVKGVFGSAQVQLTTSCLPVQKLVNNDQQNQNIKKFKQDIDSLEKKIGQIKINQNKQRNKNKKAQMNIQIKGIEEQIKKKKDQINKIENQKDNKIKKYYIPQKDFYVDILNNKIQQKPLPSNVVLHGISNLAIRLPNKTVISVIPQSLQQLKNQNTQKVQKKDQIYPQDIRKRLRQKVQDLSEKQLAQYSRHKMNFMYQKYGTYRFLAAIIFGIAFVSGASVVYRSRVKSLSGSLLIYNMQKQFYSHPKILALKNLNIPINKTTWSKSIGGGMRNKNFSVIIDVNGIPKGRVIINGVHDQEKGQSQYSKFTFQYTSKGKKQIIDLLN